MKESRRMHPVDRSSLVRLVLAVLAATWSCSRLPAEDPAAVLRERYLGPDGLPSPAAYARAHEIAPLSGSETFAWQVVFRLAYRAEDAERLLEAEPVYTDCYFVRRRQYDAAYRAVPVWDGRVYQSNRQLVVGAYTPQGEKISGLVDTWGSLHVDLAGVYELYSPQRQLHDARYNPFTGLLWRRAEGGSIVEVQRVHLPLPLMDVHGRSIQPHFRIVRVDKPAFALVARSGDTDITIATCVLAGDDVARRRTGYTPVLGQRASMVVDEPMIVIEKSGQILADALVLDAGQLALKKELPTRLSEGQTVQVDGRFDEWRSIPGIADPEADVVSYLANNPDTDLLEFKVASDENHLYFYTRVAGRHGNTAGDRDRYYFYVYIDADRNPATGYIPTRDDNCYYGVAIGDDCEAQFEFVNGRFVKTFFGFAGGSTEKDVLAGRVALAPSWYSKQDDEGRLREGYKVEYVRHGDEIKITEDFAEGTTDDIVIALSPDGSECEMRAALGGFLRDETGAPIMAAGQSIDLAAGAEASGQVRGNTRWSADSTAVIRGYVIGK